MKVAKEDGGLRTSYDQDDKNQEKEAKHIIHLMRPAKYIPERFCVEIKSVPFITKA